MQPLEFPDYRKLVGIVVDFCRVEPKTEHFKAVQLICSSALEYYAGILRLIEDQNARSAKALSRSLLDTLVSAAILAKHPEKIEDFRDCGRYSHIRSLRSFDWEIDPEIIASRDNLIAKHGVDYPQLDRRFRNKPWHGLKRKAAFIEAGFADMVYGEFYRHASQMIHAEPDVFVMRGSESDWIFGRSDINDLRFLAGAYVSSTQFLITGMGEINRELDLSFGEQLTDCRKSLHEFVPKYRASMLEEKSAMGSRIQRGLRIAMKKNPPI